MLIRGLPITAVALAFLGLASTGCIITPRDEPVPTDTTGVLSVVWTVQGSTSPAGCAAARADTIAIDVFAPSGARLLTAHAPCEDFGRDLELDPGNYAVDFTLVDVNNKSVTTTLSLPTTLQAGAVTDLRIDFPSGSFLQP